MIAGVEGVTITEHGRKRSATLTADAIVRVKTTTGRSGQHAAPGICAATSCEGDTAPIGHWPGPAGSALAEALSSDVT